MMYLKIFYSLIFLCLVMNSACSNGSEEVVQSSAESLFFLALSSEEPDEEQLLTCAEEMIFPWSGEALIILSEEIITKPRQQEIKKINRLWKKYISRHGVDDHSLILRQSLALLDGGRPDDLLSSGELADPFFVNLDRLSRNKTDDQREIYNFLGGEPTDLELEMLLSYLGETGLINDLDQSILDWISLKQYNREQNYSQGYGVLTNLDRSPMVTSYGAYYRDSWRILLSHPDRWHIIETWEIRGGEFDRDNRWEPLFYSALSRRALNSYRSAAVTFQRAAGAARTDLEYDRSLWYQLDCLGKAGEDLTGFLIESAPQWRDPAYYDDLFDQTVSELVFSGQWRKLIDLEKSAQLWGSAYQRDRLGWIIARAGEIGYLELTPEEERTRYEEISQRNEGNWYTLVAQTELSGEVRYYDTLSSTASRIKDISLMESLSLREKIFWGFIERDMLEQAREWYSRYRSDFSIPILREYAYFLRRQGDFLESIRTMGYAIKKEGYLKTREDLLLLYPLEYSGQIEYWCGVYGISELLFRALIKTESGYNKDIISYAGAVGLSQLMPTTAQERMELMGIDSADLTNADVNISLGTNYMKWLYEREYIENNVQATAAYNGGPGSVRKWNRTMGYYPEILYMEGIPFTQTREYVQSLLQGAVIYGYLYGNTPPDQTLREMLPETFKHNMEE
jgi:soluble lytic murein transglycosylase-like protein